MKPSRILAALIVSAVAALSLCANAGAANVIVGPSLTGSWESEVCGIEACTYINDVAAGEPVGLRSPIDGTIVRASVVGGSTAGTYRVGTALKFSNFGFTFVRWGKPVASSPTEGVQSFSAAVPVQKGMWISLAVSETASLGFREGVGQLLEWGFEPEESESSVESEMYPEELAGFDVEIQPPPTVTSLGATSGSTAGGTPVTLSGADLENATSVVFGTAPATGFTVDSESQITAIAPASAGAGAVSVTVTTPAGKATAPQQFGYVTPPPPPVVITPAPTLKKTKPKPVKQCVVPNLKGKKLSAAKAALKKGDCKAGKVTKLKGATPKTGKVAAQSRKAGAKAVAGAKVNLTLKP